MNSGNIYATTGTIAQLSSALAILDAHRETSYAGFDTIDTTEINIIQVPGMAKKSYVFGSVSNTANAQRALAILNFGTSSARPIIVETTAQSVAYIDYVTGFETTVVNSSNGVQVSTIDINNPAARAAPCGNGTIACVQHAYSNNGWISVWAFVQSAYIPFTAFAIAADCAIHNC